MWNRLRKITVAIFATTLIVIIVKSEYSIGKT